MRKAFRRVAALGLCLSLLFCMIPTVQAEEATDAAGAELAEDISGKDRVTAKTGFPDVSGLFNGDTIHAVVTAEESSLTLEYEEGIGSLYLVFDLEYGDYTVINNDTGDTHIAGETGLLHEFLDLTQIFGGAPKSVTLNFEHGIMRLNELSIFTTGQVPDWVQRWELPKDGETDLILFSTHGDDEQLFFAGILPYYAAELGYQVQVCYLTNHRNNTYVRCHEMLNGLWAVGVKTYPVFGTFRDFFVDTGAKAYSTYAVMGTPEEELLGFVVEQLRRFKPQVVVGHDPINGEYGHGLHILYADLLMKAVEISNDETKYPELAEQYGLWDVPKTYLHLYPENPIVMDWDQPLEKFNGMTAFEVTKHLGFVCHETQYLDFAWYIAYPTKATEVAKYSPCDYGLYRTTVGPDAAGGDFFENVTTYAETARLQAEAEEAARRAEEEAKRQAEEEAARQEAERKAAEESKQTQKEQLLRQEQEAKKASRDKMLLLAGVAAIVAIIAVAVAAVLIIRHRANIRKKYFEEF